MMVSPSQLSTPVLPRTPILMVNLCPVMTLCLTPNNLHQPDNRTPHLFLSTLTTKTQTRTANWAGTTTRLILETGVRQLQHVTPAGTAPRLLGSLRLRLMKKASPVSPRTRKSNPSAPCPGAVVCSQTLRLQSRGQVAAPLTIFRQMKTPARSSTCPSLWKLSAPQLCSNQSMARSSAARSSLLQQVMRMTTPLNTHQATATV